jgi:Periplasmic binding protein
VIGASLPLSGDFAQPGEASRRGYAIWQDMVNKNGGLLKRQVQLKIADDASDQNTVVSDYNRLISQDKVNLLLGSFSSLLSIPASAVAERNRMTYICPSCGSPDMFNRNFKNIFFAQPATGGPPGRPVRPVGDFAAGQPAPQDRRLPDPGRPVRPAGGRGHQGQAGGRRDQDRVQQGLSRRDHQLRHHRQ